MDDIDRLRWLAFNLTTADAHPPQEGRLEPALEPRVLALVRLAAVVAMGGSSVASYAALTDEALGAGASSGDVVDVLIGTLTIVGTARVVAAAPALAMALGHDTGDLPGAEW